MQNTLIGSIILGGLCLALAIAPFSVPKAAAYTSTNQLAIQLDEQRALFIVQFAFGTRFNDFFIPIQAVRSEVYGSERDVLGYDIIADRAGATAEGVTRSLVLSDLEVVDNAFYRIPAGSNGFFTLVTELSVPAGIPDSEYLVQVNSLPHYVGEKRERRTVNEIELRSFISPGIELNLPGS